VCVQTHTHTQAHYFLVLLVVLLNSFLSLQIMNIEGSHFSKQVRVRLLNFGVDF
jgi:hypothetical protein